MQGDLNLNIAEAHAFNTTDRFTLDVFVVNGWSNGSVEELEEVLSQRLQVLNTALKAPYLLLLLQDQSGPCICPSGVKTPSRALPSICRSFRRPVCVKRAQAPAPALRVPENSLSSSILTGRRCALASLRCDFPGLHRHPVSAPYCTHGN